MPYRCPGIASPHNPSQLWYLLGKGLLYCSSCIALRGGCIPKMEIQFRCCRCAGLSGEGRPECERGNCARAREERQQSRPQAPQERVRGCRPRRHGGRRQPGAAEEAHPLLQVQVSQSCPSCQPTWPTHLPLQAVFSTVVASATCAVLVQLQYLRMLAE